MTGSLGRYFTPLKLDITQEMIVQELAKLAFSDVGGPVRNPDKHNALVSLAKILGFMQPTRVTVAAPDGGPVQLLGLTPDELRAEAALILGSIGNIGNIEEEAIEAEMVDEAE